MFKSLDHFEIDEIKVFVDISLSTLSFANVSHGLSGVHWQQTLQMDNVFKYPIPDGNVLYRGHDCRVLALTVILGEI